MGSPTKKVYIYPVIPKRHSVLMFLLMKLQGEKSNGIGSESGVLDFPRDRHQMVFGSERGRRFVTPSLMLFLLTFDF